MTIALIMIFLFIFLVYLRMFRPWVFIDGRKYNVNGLDINGETKEDCNNKFSNFIEWYEK